VTYAQYEAFVQAEDGYDNPEWWAKFPEEYRPQPLTEQRTKSANNPRDTISWYQSVAFTHWLDAKYREKGWGIDGKPYQIRLATEWEWQWMAQNGAESREYAWGNGWVDLHANTNEAGLGRAIAVGMYPNGKAACEALDVVGNLWEWCLNDYQKTSVIDGYASGAPKVLRGGSFNRDQSFARSAARYALSPLVVSYRYGFRVFSFLLRL
jgi:formylglycine-generating enzyme required for sulfatase activity